MEQTIRHVKASNEMAKHNNLWIRVVTALFVVALILIAAVFGLAWKTLEDMSKLERQLSATTIKLDTVASELQKVKESTDAADVDREGQTRIELVPEPDPKKALEAPIKVRISPPVVPATSEHPAATGGSVEVPLPVKDVVVAIPKDSGERK